MLWYSWAGDQTSWERCPEGRPGMPRSVAETLAGWYGKVVRPSCPQVLWFPPSLLCWLRLQHRHLTPPGSPTPYPRVAGVGCPWRDPIYSWVMLGPQLYPMARSCAGQEGEGRDQVTAGCTGGGSLRSGITGAEAEPRSRPLRPPLGLLAREQLPSLLSPNLSEKLFTNRKRQIN